ncbi:MAG: hypothetical protein MJ094_04365 [Saccharofermentans sp.]|nr:hypothetical protein [Saccharofermentans sp.]
MSALKLLLTKNNNIEKDAYIFNTIYGVLNAIQVVLVLAVLTRVSGLAVSGIFTITWTVANLLVNIGKYGMRSYQATDINQNYTFIQYLKSRIATTLLMVIICFLYSVIMLVFFDYGMEKISMIILLTLLKGVDSLEDVFLGEYQREGRMDIASRCSAYRLGITIFCYLLSIIVTHNIYLSTIITLVISIIFASLFIKVSFSEATGNKMSDVLRVRNNEHTEMRGLLCSCFTIFASVFLYFFIVNAPRFSIDLYLSSEEQSLFGFISMPVFVIDLLSQFLYMPKLKDLSEMIENKDSLGIRKFINLQLLVSLSLTVFGIIVALTIGTPILTFIYGSSVVHLKLELVLLMAGSGFMAYSVFLMNMIIVIRKQKSILVGYGITAIVSLVMCGLLVNMIALLGASIAYLGSMLVLAICMTAIIVKYRRIIWLR